MENYSNRKSLPTRFVEAVAVALLAILVTLVTMQVFMRYIMHSPLVWSEEMARMSFIWFAFIGAGLGFRYHLDLRVTFFADMLPTRYGLLLRLVIHVVEVAFMVVILWNGWFLNERIFSTPTPALYWTKSTFYGGIMGGGLVILAYALVRVKEVIEAMRETGRSN
ncbi:MAG TPA: TRAP transporter small permease [Chloroflexota bacterium]